MNKTSKGIDDLCYRICLDSKHASVNRDLFNFICEGNNSKSFSVSSFYLSLLFLFIFILNCFGQEAAFKNYNEQNGLPSSEVYHVFQDTKGFIWFSTDNGVVRFDGGEFKLFNKSNGLSDQVVFSTIEDPNGNLWFRTFSGATSIYHHKEGRMTPYKFNDRITSLPRAGVIPVMVVDSLGQVYFTDVWNGLYRISNTGSLESMKMKRGVIHVLQITKNNFNVTLAINSPANVSTASLNGVTYNLPIENTDRLGYIFCKLWRRDMYLSVNDRLFRLRDSKTELVYTAKQPIISLSVDKEDNLWLGFLSDGVVRFSTNTFSRPWRLPLLKGRSVTSVLQDNDGGFWYSTLEKGIYYIPDLSVQNYSLSRDSKVNFVLTNNKNVFVGFYDGTLLNLDKKTKAKKWSIDLKAPIVSGVFLKNDSLLWISTSGSSVLLDKEGTVVKKFSDVTKFVLKKYFRTYDRIWGVNGYGALEFDSESNLLSFHKLAFWSRNIFVIDNDVYLAGVTGLYKTDKSFHKITEIPGFNNDKISGLTLLPGRKILVSTIGNGFKIIDGEKKQAYSKNEGFIFESIYTSVVDSCLWLGTEKGLLKVDLKQLLDKRELSYKLLDKASGMVDNKVNFIMRNGSETWCILNDGFSVFNNHEVHFANNTPIPRLNRVTVNSNPVTSTDLHDLSFQENNICFDFGFQSYNSRTLFLRHRSSSLGQWNYTKDFNINYYSLAPGKYKVDVEYSTDRRHWKKIIFPNVVHVKPVWWETIYFRLTVLFITLLVAGVIFFIYFRAKYKSRLLKLELANQLKSEKGRIAQDLHDNIGSRLISLSLGFNQIVKEYEIEYTTAEQIHSNVHSTVSELRDTIWAIQKDGVTLSEFSDKLRNLIWRLRQNKGTVHYDLQIEVEHNNLVLKPTQAINLYRIIQEAIANSQKHSEASVLLVAVYEDSRSNCFCIKVEDNGKGFVIDHSQMNGHYGLKNMKARAEEINASFEISTALNKGTHVIVSLQLSNKG